MKEAVYVFFRKDLKFPIGKAVAQAVHAVRGLNYDIGAPVIVLKVDDEKHLRGIVGDNVIVDAGRTVFKEPTTTCGAIVAPLASFDDLSLL